MHIRRLALIALPAVLSVPVGAVAVSGTAFAATPKHAVSVDKQHKESGDTSKDTTKEGSSNDKSNDRSKEGSSNDKSNDRSKEDSNKDTSNDRSTERSGKDSSKDKPSTDTSPSPDRTAN